ncbi:MAG: hypothetical protein ABFD96_25395 [Armatimonadia bacterium]
MVWYAFGNWTSQQPLSMTGGSGGGGGTRVTVTSTLRDRTPVPQAKPLEEGQVIWGRPSSFSWGSNAGDFAGDPVIGGGGGGGGGITFPPDDEEEQPMPLVEEWVEVNRIERTVRITGPNDAYVDFARLDEVTFQLPNLPDGRQHYVTQKFKKFGDEQ